MPDFVHPSQGSIRCPFHNRQETFTAGTIIQPIDPLLARYPCGYVERAGTAASTEPALLSPDRDELIQELANRLRRLEERGAPRRTPSTPSTPAPQTPAKKGGVAL